MALYTTFTFTVNFVHEKKSDVVVFVSSTQLVCSTNDNAPVFSRDQYEAEVTLGESPGHRVMNVKATDADSGLQ